MTARDREKEANNCGSSLALGVYLQRGSKWNTAELSSAFPFHISLLAELCSHYGFKCKDYRAI